jgi:hypothetical protein
VTTDISSIHLLVPGEIKFGTRVCEPVDAHVQELSLEEDIMRAQIFHHARSFFLSYYLSNRTGKKPDSVESPETTRGEKGVILTSYPAGLSYRRWLEKS